MEQGNIGGRSYTAINPTWSIALRVWWSYSWRMLTWVFSTALIGAVLGGVLVKVSGGTDNDVGVVGAFIMFVLILIMNVVVIKRILRLKYKDFRVVLISRRD